MQEAGILEFAQDGIEELLGDAVLLGDLGNQSGLAGLPARQMHHRLEAVFALFCQHAAPGTCQRESLAIIW